MELCKNNDSRFKMCKICKIRWIWSSPDLSIKTSPTPSNYVHQDLVLFLFPTEINSFSPKSCICIWKIPQSRFPQRDLRISFRILLEFCSAPSWSLCKHHDLWCLNVVFEILQTKPCRSIKRTLAPICFRSDTHTNLRNNSAHAEIHFSVQFCVFH